MIELNPKNPVNPVKIKVGIIGTGRVGTAIGYALYKKGYQIIGRDRKTKKVRDFYRLLHTGASRFDGSHPYLSNIDVAKNSDLIFITTQDSEIIKVSQEILPYLNKGQIIVHCSGVLSNSIFKQAEKGRVRPGLTGRTRIIVIGLHPIQTFPAIGNIIRIGLNPTRSTRSHLLFPTKNIYYAVEAKAKARQIAKRIVKDLQGTPVFISGKDKPLYHIMCVFASNYLVTLMSAVLDIANELKIKPNIAFKILEPLINQTLLNIKKSGIEKSLTGPIEREDIETIKTHLEVLNKKMPELLPLYQTLGLKTLALVKTKIATKIQKR